VRVDGSTEDPTEQLSFVDVTAYSFIEAPGPVDMIASLTPGSWSIVCFHLAGTAERVFPGSGPFNVTP